MYRVTIAFDIDAADNDHARDKAAFVMRATVFPAEVSNPEIVEIEDPDWNPI